MKHSVMYMFWFRQHLVTSVDFKGYEHRFCKNQSDENNIDGKGYVSYYWDSRSQSIDFENSQRDIGNKMGSFYENATANLLSYSQHLELKHTSGAGYWNYEASTYEGHTGSGFNF